MKKYSIMMPLKINDLNSFKIFTEISLPLYSKFLNINDLDYFYIICPKEDNIPIMKFTRLYPGIPFKFINENILLNDNTKHEQGWFKQQLIKLSISLLINTEHYLVVDSDMYLTQTLSYKDLFCDGKIKYQFEPWQELNNEQFSTNSKWWRSSCDILKFDVTQLYDKQYLMGVTPQLFITNKVKGLIDHLLDIYGFNWQKTICEMKFTEYTLYWIYLIITNSTNLYTTQGYPLWVHDLERNILRADTQENMKHIIERSVTEKKSYFSVIQGYLPVDISEMKDVIFKEIHVKYDAVFLVASMTNPNRSQAFERNDRRQQITDTLNSIKHKVPNSICILIEGSVLTEYERYEYYRHYDIVLELGNDESILPYVNHPGNIGHGEMKLLERGIDYLEENVFNKFDISYIFKISSRYRLSDQFTLTNYVTDKYCFKEVMDSSINDKVFVTGLYSIPVKEILDYKRILIEGQNVLSKTCNMVEKMYHDMILPEKIHVIENLGLEGMLSYNKKYFNI